MITRTAYRRSYYVEKIIALADAGISGRMRWADVLFQSRVLVLEILSIENEV